MAELLLAELLARVALLFRQEVWEALAAGRIDCVVPGSSSREPPTWQKQPPGRWSVGSSKLPPGSPQDSSRLLSAGCVSSPTPKRACQPVCVKGVAVHV
jgi:hypothetical protein